MLLTIAQAYQMKGDSDNVIIYAERVLKEGDPKNYEAMLMLSESYAQRTREFDLDKEEKLGKADKLRQRCPGSAEDGGQTGGADHRRPMERHEEGLHRARPPGARAFGDDPQEV